MILSPARYKELFQVAANKADTEVAAAIASVENAYIVRWVGEPFYFALNSRPAGAELVYSGDATFVGFDAIIASLTNAYLSFSQVQATRLGAVTKKGQFSATATQNDILAEVSRRRKEARMQVCFFRNSWWPRVKDTMPEELANTELLEVFNKEENILGEFRP